MDALIGVLRQNKLRDPALEEAFKLRTKRRACSQLFSSLITKIGMDAKELHLLYILLDSNLPTGGFVSSSGLESYAKHGFLSRRSTSSSGAGPSKTTTVADAIVEFSRAEVENYHSTTGGFVKRAWEAVDAALGGGCLGTGDRQGWHGKGKQRETPVNGVTDHSGVDDGEDQTRLVEMALKRIERLDAYHEACLLSHVSRRASKAQGIAMLTLYSRGLSRPPGHSSHSSDDPNGVELEGGREEIGKKIIDGYKRSIRTGASPGHLAVCWGVMTSALGLPLERAIHLHLFLHARSLLSSAVRLNLIGPYLSSQLLLHPFEDIIAAQLKRPPNTGADSFSPDCRHENRGFKDGDEEDDGNDSWAWTHVAERGPATTYPLGEILMARHDLQHSRIFNS